MANDPNNPYCRPRAVGGSPFYSQAPRQESLYRRGYLGPPVFGPYQDKWTGTEWLRPNGSKAPLSGLGVPPLLQNGWTPDLQTQGVRSGDVAFVAKASSPLENVPCPPGMVRRDGQCVPMMLDGGGGLTSPQAFVAPKSTPWMLYGAIGLAVAGGAYLFLRRK